MACGNANPTRRAIDHELKSLTPEDLATMEIENGIIFDLIRNINDPEHPNTLEDLNVVDQSNVLIDGNHRIVTVLFTPTIPHCSMATLIGLSIKVKLMRSLLKRYKIEVAITPGSNVSEAAINKQLADKERVAAALENNYLLSLINQCIDVQEDQ